MFAAVSNVSGQSTSVFADGEAQRVYDLLDGLGCIGNANCWRLGDFTPNSSCDYNPGYVECNDAGRLGFLCVYVLVYSLDVTV
jgi:hypothetical protein